MKKLILLLGCIFALNSYAGTWVFKNNEAIFTIFDEDSDSEELFKIWDYKWPEHSNSRAMKEFRTVDDRLKLTCVYHGPTTCSASIRLLSKPKDTTDIEFERNYYGAVFKNTKDRNQATELYDAMQIEPKGVPYQGEHGLFLVTKKYSNTDEKFVLYCAQVETAGGKKIARPGYAWCNVAIKLPEPRKRRKKNR